MADYSELIVPDLPTLALSERNQRILDEALQKANQPSLDPAFLVHKELHRRYWKEGEVFPSIVGRPVDVGIPHFAYNGKIIVF